MTFETFKHDIATDLSELYQHRRMQRAVALSNQTGQHFNHNEYPMYFTGKLDAQVVLVHLNPKQNNYADDHKCHLWHKDLDSYLDYHQHFGKRLYGEDSPRTHKSPFDHKQIRFLKPFGVLPFVEESSSEDRFINLERVIDEKLQLELIPYGSATFSSRGFTPAILAPHLARILDVISAAPRKYVLFCGRVFENLLSEHVTRRHTFNLVKNSGESTRNQARFANVCFSHNDQDLRAGIATSFAQQGIPMGDYGKQCYERYHLS